VSDSTPLTDEEIKDQALNLKAWNHLPGHGLSRFWTATMSNSYEEGWLALLEEYHKNDIHFLVILSQISQILSWLPSQKTWTTMTRATKTPTIKARLECRMIMMIHTDESWLLSRKNRVTMTIHALL
jgi:hypothetical protein